MAIMCKKIEILLAYLDMLHHVYMYISILTARGGCKSVVYDVLVAFSPLLFTDSKSILRRGCQEVNQLCDLRMALQV